MNRLLAVACCAALLGGCSNTITQANPPAVTPIVVPTIVPPAHGSPIQHVIILVQENRTMDNMFNGFPGADTVTSGLNSHDHRVALQPQGLEWEYDPDHAHASLVKEYNDGKMNGFDKDKCDLNPLASPCVPPPNFTYSFVPSSETLFLWVLGGAFGGHGYAIADRMFSGRQVPSFPGHLGLIAGQGPADDPIGQGESSLAAIWGCDAPKGARVGQRLWKAV